MAVLYLLFGLIVIGMNAKALPFAFKAIVNGAFQPEGVAGGMLGVMMIGFQRAVFSNEAGIGSAAIAHAAVKTDQPITEGLVAMLEPLIDTVIICTVTALVVITTSYYQPGLLSELPPGIATTSSAFARQISWFPYPLAVAALLFAFSTMISWAYYGLKGWTYLVGSSSWAENSFKLAFCAFVALGCMIQLQAVLDFSDALVFVICIPNLLGLYLLAPAMKQELGQYFAGGKASHHKDHKPVG